MYRYIIQNSQNKMFVSWVTESTGRIYYCKKPTTANYFLTYLLAHNWMVKNFDIKTFEVIKIQTFK